MRTSGGPPAAPLDIRWIRANATHASFDTIVWSDGGCGPVALKLEWAGSGIAGSRDVPVGGEVILGGEIALDFDNQISLKINLRIFLIVYIPNSFRAFSWLKISRRSPSVKRSGLDARGVRIHNDAI